MAESIRFITIIIIIIIIISYVAKNEYLRKKEVIEKHDRYTIFEKG